jgi:hypothetical protein
MAFGGLKTFVGLERERPVGFLVASLVGLLVFVIFQAAGEGTRLSARGKRFLQKERAAEKARGVAAHAWTAPAFVISVALLGYAQLDAFGLPELRRALAPAGDSSAGGGSSGDGGSDGGGCGGCGGGD